ncbi:hypothetical protein VKS41_007647 [Umbelopsis sp. WA50703]
MWRMQRQLGTIAQRSIHVAAHTKRSPVALLPRTTLPTAALLPIGGRLVSATCGKLTVAYAISKRFYNSGPQGGFRLQPQQEQQQEKPLEQYGIDLTAMAEKGKLGKEL